MRQVHKRISSVLAVLVLLTLLVALLGCVQTQKDRQPDSTALDNAARPSVDPDARSWLTFMSVGWLNQYRAKHDGVYPHSPDGPDAALEMVISASRCPKWVRQDLTLLHPMWPDTGNEGFRFLYLNPEPGTELAPDTIILVERDFYWSESRGEYRGRGLHVGMVNGEVHFFFDLSGRPEDLLGKRLSELSRITGDEVP